ncbi:MAG: DUF4115 domain-containing protein [Desulfotomaculum sp.]|nr:DUF4115 domain-containing protein [Desulfotomaculum sp.]
METEVKVGNSLKKTRLEKGYSLTDIEQATKIRTKYIQALEEEQFDLLPGRVYEIAFIRNYAKFLDLDDQELIRQYKELSATSSVDNTPTPVISTANTAKTTTDNKQGIKSSRYILYLVPVVLISVLIVAVLAYQSMIPWWEDTKLIELPGIVQDNQQLEPTAPDIDNEQQQITPELEEQVTVHLNIVNDRCWIKVKIDGQVEFTGTLYAGATKEFIGKESVYLELGNAGVVEVQVNGEKLGFLAPPGQVIRKEFKSTPNTY